MKDRKVQRRKKGKKQPKRINKIRSFGKFKTVPSFSVNVLANIMHLFQNKRRKCRFPYIPKLFRFVFNVKEK
ncbi:MAG TPA: hypothetical protein DDZ96_11160 [Porphyromonadaceae bacterium]|nr:hypothetical protein [Porphyromonadaceae bacterium]HBK30585.1 hypothetical protein [Porphyromonadaceae bacterium]HBL34358.1 hypothetical protein [Porphyromonadaceae bacterium]HBX20066.1 hypothetical protein [Porphyromonadaceae bacterium]